NADLQLNGNVKRPQLFGKMRLDELQIEAGFMPFEMLPGHLELTFNGMDSALQGIVRSTRGQINLVGNADWHRPQWRAKIMANGSKVRINIPPMARLDISPDITFEATPDLLMLDGKVDIPWARITVNELPETAVSVSSDEVMLD